MIEVCPRPCHRGAPRRVILSAVRRDLASDLPPKDKHGGQVEPRRGAVGGIYDGYGDSGEVDPCVASLLGFALFVPHSAKLRLRATPCAQDDTENVAFSKMTRSFICAIKTDRRGSEAARVQ